MAQSWPWGSQLAVKKRKKKEHMVSKNLCNICILYIKNIALYMSFNIIMSFNGDYVKF